MDVIGTGLLNREMIRAIKDRWQQGGVGLLYVQLHEEFESSKVALQRWEKEQKRLMWRQRLDNDLFYMFYRKQKDDPILEVLDKVAQELVSYKGLEGSISGIGTSSVSPSVSGRSVESVVYQAIKEAFKDAEQSKRCMESVELKPEIAEEIQILEQAIGLYGGARSSSNTNSNEHLFAIGQLAASYPVFSCKARVSEVGDLFDTNSKVQGVIIADHGIPSGLLMKEKLHQMLAGQFGLPLYWNRAVEKIMNVNPLIVDADMPVEQVSQLAMARDYSQLYDIVIITQNGKLLGATSIRSILECMTALRTEAARTANPLTGLPGNEGIQMELHRRVQTTNAFAVIYADLDYFKWFNDCFGFGKGDELICYLADVLLREKVLSGTPTDFVGHIGGDDFIMVTEAGYAEQLCMHLIERFDSGVKSFYGGMDVTAVEDRHGHVIEQEGVTLSLSLMMNEQGNHITPELISLFSAKLKKRAKAQRGSVYVMDTIMGLHHGEERM